MRPNVHYNSHQAHMVISQCSFICSYKHKILKIYFNSKHQMRQVLAVSFLHRVLPQRISGLVKYELNNKCWCTTTQHSTVSWLAITQMAKLQTWCRINTDSTLNHACASACARKFYCIAVKHRLVWKSVFKSLVNPAAVLGKCNKQLDGQITDRHHACSVSLDNVASQIYIKNSLLLLWLHQYNTHN